MRVTAMVQQAVRSDEELAAAFAGGERAAIERLVERHAGWVFGGRAQRQLGEDERRAEDATQAVFLLLCQRAGKFRGRVRVSGWLFLATQFTVRAMQRTERRRRLHERRAAMEQKLAEDGGAELAGFWMRRCKMRLPERERAAVVLRFYQGKEFAEVSAGVGDHGDGGARKRVTRAVSVARTDGERGVGCGDWGGGGAWGADASRGAGGAC